MRSNWAWRSRRNSACGWVSVIVMGPGRCAVCGLFGHLTNTQHPTSNSNQTWCPLWICDLVVHVHVLFSTLFFGVKQGRASAALGWTPNPLCRPLQCPQCIADGGAITSKDGHRSFVTKSNLKYQRRNVIAARNYGHLGPMVIVQILCELVRQ